MNRSDILIRKFHEEDRPDIRRISCDTALIKEKETGSDLFSDNEILADALTAYFTDYEPDSCFVATCPDKVIGYVIGSRNMTMMEKIFKLRIAPLLLFKAVRKGVLFKKDNWTFLLHCMASLLRGEFRIPDFSKEYPATLHINIDENFRGSRLGTRLMEFYLNFLKEKGVSGVQLSTASEKAKTFFTKLGFKPLFETKRTFLKYATGEDLSYSVFGRKL